MPLLQQVAESAAPGGAIQWLWAVPMLPLLGFLINGGLSLLSATKLAASGAAAMSSTSIPASSTAATKSFT